MIKRVKIKRKIDLKEFFNPESIAIIGATEKEGKVGNVITKNILELGFQGDVFLINPSHQTLFEQKSYPALSDIHREVDLAIVVVPAKYVNDIIKKGSGKCKNFIVISAGFSEIGEEGVARGKELLEIANEEGLNILGPNCLGFINPRIKLNASFAGGMPEDGRVAFISQSGALAVALMDRAKSESIEFSGIVSIGNKLQIGEADLIRHFGSDERTKVVALYIEGIKHGREFIEAVSEVSKKKPVVVLKAGKTEKAQRAISSHTGALTGSDEIMNAVFEKAGVIRAENLEEFFDLVKMFSNFDPPVNNEVIIATNAGGPGVLATDSFLGKEINLSEISETGKEKLREFLPSEASIENPIDLLGDAQEDRYKKAMEAVEGEKAGSILCVLTPQDQTPDDKIANVIADFKNKTDKLVAVSFIGKEKIGDALEILRDNGIPNFSFPERAVGALDKYYYWKKDIKKRSELAEGEKINSKRRNKAEKIIKKAKDDGRKALLFSEATEIMALYGVSTVDFENIGANNRFSDKIHFPVVAKVDSDKVLHKTDQKAIVLGIENEEELTRAISEIRESFKKENIIIQPMRKIQNELILGVKKDDVFGPVFVYGLGGIYTEIFKMVDFILLPETEISVREKVMKSKIKFLFSETRGKQPCDAREFSGILSSLISLAGENPEIKELDINPLLVYNDGRRAEAVDVKIII